MCLTGTTRPSQRFDDGTQGSNGDSITCTLSLSPILLCACLRACLFIASLFLVVLFRDILALSRLSAGPSADVSSPHLAVSRHRHPPEASKRTETLARARGTRLTSQVDRRAGHARPRREAYKILCFGARKWGSGFEGTPRKKAGGPRVVTPCWGGYDFEILSGVGPAGTRPKKKNPKLKGRGAGDRGCHSLKVSARGYSRVQVGAAASRRR